MNFRTDHIGTDPEPRRTNISGSPSVYVPQAKSTSQQPASTRRRDCSNPRFVPITAYYSRRQSQLEQHEFELRERQLERQSQSRRLSAPTRDCDTTADPPYTSQANSQLGRRTETNLEQPPAYNSLVDGPPAYDQIIGDAQSTNSSNKPT